jgi:hypothetical protein
MTINVFGGSFDPTAPVFPLQRSVRLRASNTAYFNRTLTTPTSSTIWTWSAWVKRGALTGTYRLFGASTTTYLTFNSSDQLNLTLNGVSAATSTAVFRDPAAWYHIVYQQNGSAQTIYVNNASVATGTTAASIFNTAIAHQIGAANTTNYFDGYLTEINFIDGQALTPASFGSINSTTGVWQPNKYTGTYGTNGFYLNFNDNSNNTAATIGKDNSGNSNNWTPNGISVTAGVTYDSMLDVPTNTGSTNANFAVMNPLIASINGSTLSEANLKFTSPLAATGGCLGTIGVSSGKWYWEVTHGGIVSGSNDLYIGIDSNSSPTAWGNTSATMYSYWSSNGNKVNNASLTAYGASYTTNDVIGVALDMDVGTLTFYKNNTSQGTAFSSLSGTYFPAVSDGGGSQLAAFANFGQRPFSYTPPTGFKSLNTYNLPTPTIPNGAANFAATTYAGTGSSLAIANTVNGKSFQPDFVWVKGRSGATDHALYDSVRGTTLDLVSNSTAAETTQATGLTAFGSTGFTVGALAKLNTNTATYVGWQWKASNASAVTNTSGSISSQVSANPSAGFSIVTYTGTGANATVGHGLGIAPRMIIVKNRDSGAIGGAVYHASIGATKYLKLFQTTTGTDGEATDNTAWNGGSPTFSGSVFSVGTLNRTNSAQQMVAYCFSEIAGYSKFGSYTGNSSTDGTFVYTGFRPRFVMVKRSDAVSNWVIWDSSRRTNNETTAVLYPHLSQVEDNPSLNRTVDFLSNGFKLRQTSGDVNGSGGVTIYAAFAESPFNYSLAR